MPKVADTSFRINAERLVVLAWLRAILLQLAHPMIAAGVAQHSTFRGSPMAAIVRLHHTIGAMLAISFGTDTERQHALDGIRAIHRRVHGTLATTCGPFAAGTPYSAEDCDLLLWVHATLVESVVLGYEQFVERLTPDQRDRYCADSADVAVALGACAEDVPRSWEALRQLIQRVYGSGRIVVGPEARGLASALLMPLPGSIGRRLGTPILELLAAGQLPSNLRVQYGLSWNVARERRFTQISGAIRRLRHMMPTQLAWWKAARFAACLGGSDGETAPAR
jgi:uncharacterized protein (DUF2236 family)